MPRTLAFPPTSSRRYREVVPCSRQRGLADLSERTSSGETTSPGGCRVTVIRA